MSIWLVIVLFVLLVAACVLLAIGLGFPVLGGAGGGAANTMRNMVASQREAVRYNTKDGSQSLFETAEQSHVERVSNSQLTLEKKLKYARWRMPVIVYRLLQVSISLVAFFIVSLKLNIAIQLIALFTGPIFMGVLLNRAMSRRFDAFDQDYPSFLLSLVGLLKTGMNPLTALAAAAEGLEENALVRIEVELMLERLRLGVTEDQSIGAFGEDIYHPEIELFVQALLLSRRVGGNLSETLESLAGQVRKRQYFRQSAHSAVAMQRASIWVIFFILMGIQIYLYLVSPELVVGAWESAIGWQIWQTGLLVIALGMYLITQVTKIRV